MTEWTFYPLLILTNVIQFGYFVEDLTNAVHNYIYLCYLCHVFVMLSRLFIAALWSPVGKMLISGLSFVMFDCVFVTFPCSIVGQV